MNSPSVAPGGPAQFSDQRARGHFKHPPPDYAPTAVPESVSQDHLPLSTDGLQPRPPARPWDSERSNRSGASSPPFSYDSPTSSAQSVRGTGASPNPPADALRPESPLLPPRGKEGAGAAARGAASPLGQLNWGAQNASVRTELQDIKEALGKVIPALQGVIGQVQTLNGCRVLDDQRIRDLQRQVDVYGEHVQAMQELRKEVQLKDAELRALIAQAFERLDSTQNSVKNLTELCVENTEDKFEALGPLPKNYRRVQTSNGPYALHNDVYRRLIPFLDFHGAPPQADARRLRTHVEVSRQMLSHLAMWQNGLSLAPELLGYAAVRDLCAFARRRDIKDLLEVTLKELHEAGMAAMAPLLSQHARQATVQDMAEDMVAAMCRLQTEDVVPQGSQEQQLQVVIGRTPTGGVRSGPLFASEERAPEWRQDLRFAFRAFSLYCRVFRATVRANPQIEAREGHRVILRIVCDALA